MYQKLMSSIPYLVSVVLVFLILLAVPQTRVMAQDQPADADLKSALTDCLKSKFPGTKDSIFTQLDPRSVFDRETGRNFFWDKDRQAWRDGKTGETVCQRSKSDLTECLKSKFPGTKDSIFTQIDPRSVFDPETGRNFFWDKDKQAWRDGKTGECVCPKCPPTSPKTTTPPPSALPTPPPATIKPNELFTGFSLIREDSSPERFNTYGIEASITRYLNERLGITGDFSAHFRERNGLDISKYTFLGGVTVVPFEGANFGDKATFSLHGLFGAANNRFSFDNGVTRFSTSDTAFAMALGGGVDVNVNQKLAIRLFQADYNPTFFGNDTQHNFRLSTGLVLKFGEK